MSVKRKLNGLSVLVLSFVLLFVSMGFGSSQAHASEQGMLSANYVTENSVSIHFSNNIGRGTVNLLKDGEVIYTSSALTFDYVVTSLQSKTSYSFEINGTTTTGIEIYDQTSVTTSTIPDEPETLGPVLPDSTAPDSTGTDSPLQDDTKAGTSPYTTDTYYYWVTRTSGWDKIGKDTYGFYDPSHVSSGGFNSVVTYSTGGSFKIKINGVSGIDKYSSRTVTVTLKDWDGLLSSQQHKIKSWTIPLQTYEQNLIIDNASSYIDGSNNLAEFMVFFDTPDNSLDNFKGSMIVEYFD